MNWLNVALWAFVVLFWSSLFADIKTAAQIVGLTVLIVGLMKLDLWISDKFDGRGK